MRNRFIKGTILLLIVCTFFSVINAQVLMNYQGRLTDIGGDPVVNDVYQITFSLWDDSTGGSQQWIEVHPSVQTNSGIFTVVLGGNSTLHESVFEADPLFMQIMIAPDNYISPRTRLTSVPSAAFAKKVVGDFESSEGKLLMKSSTGDSAIIVDAGNDRGFSRIIMNNTLAYPVGPSIALTTDPSASSGLEIKSADPAIETRVMLKASSYDGAVFSLYRPGEMNFDEQVAIGMRTSFEGSTIDIYGQSPCDDCKIIHIGGDHQAKEGNFSLFECGVGTLLSLNSAPLSGGSLKMFNPQPEPPAILMELNVSEDLATRAWSPRLTLYNPDQSFSDQTLVQMSSSSNGGNMDFFRPGDGPNNPAFTIGLEPSPFNPAHLSFYDPDGTLPFDPYVKMGVEPSPWRGYFEMSDPGSGFTDGPLIRMGVEPSPFHRGFFAMYNPEIGPAPKLMEMEINDESGDWESLFRMYSIDPGDDERETFEISNSLVDGISIKMFNPQPEPPALFFEVNANTETGPSMSFHDDVGKVMGFDPSPLNEGFSIRLIDPGEDKDRFKISADYMTDDTRITFMSPGNGGMTPAIEIGSNLSSSFLNISRYDQSSSMLYEGFSFDLDNLNQSFNFRLMSPGNDDVNGFEIAASELTNSASFRLIDPGDDERSLVEISGGPSTGASIYMFNPQPEPPAKLFDLSVPIGVKSSDDVVLKLTSADGQYITKLTPGRVKVGHSTNDLYPRSELNAGADTITFFLQGNTAVLPAPPIAMMSSSGEAKMGIGTLTPSEPLVVGNDMTWFDGTMITVSDPNPTEYAGITFGENNGNRGWMVYDNEDDCIDFGTRENGVFSPNHIYIKGGDLGIGTNTPSADLHVVGDICYTGTIGGCSDRRYKTDINRLDNALDKISKLRGVSFNWKIDQYPEYKFSENEQVGLIAQEVKDVLPQVVSEDDNGYYNVDYSKITPLLIEAIKELKAENDNLKKRLSEIESSL